MGRPKHHFVPRCYLERFRDFQAFERDCKSVLWVYERNRQVRKSSPKNEARASDYYAVDLDGRKNYRFEEIIGEVEASACAILPKCESPEFFFSAEDKLTMAEFVALSFTRVPIARQFSEELMSKIIEDTRGNSAPGTERFQKEYESIKQRCGESDLSVADYLQARERVIKEFEKPGSVHRLREMFRLTARLTGYIYQLHWQLWRSDSDQLFLTSDNPVVTVRQGPGISQIGVGFGKPDVQVHFPLTARCALFMNANQREGGVGIGSQDVREFNKRVIMCARQFVYAPWKSTTISKLFDRIGGRVVYGETAFVTPAGSSNTRKS